MLDPLRDASVLALRRHAVRGKGYCAVCFGMLCGPMVDFPNEKQCAEFFADMLQVGDAICFWCLEDWVKELGDQRVTAGHA